MKIFETAAVISMCCKWSDPYARKGLDPVHFITLHEPLSTRLLDKNVKSGHSLLI